MDILVAGVGAVGAVIIKNLLKVSSLSLLLDDERKEKYKDGFILNGERIKVPFAAETDGKADLIIFAVKNFSLPKAIEEASPFVSDKTIIMSLLNGIEDEEKIEEKFPGSVISSYISEISSVHSGIETRCFSDGGVIVFGEKDGEESERVRALSSLFTSSGQRFVISKNIDHDRWCKFMLNTAFNTLSAILWADYAAIGGSRNFIRAVRVIAKEVQTVARKEKIVIEQKDIEDMIQTVTSIRNHGKTSMLQDLEEGRDTENHYFASAVSRLGKKHYIETPICDFLSILLEAKKDVG